MAGGYMGKYAVIDLTSGRVEMVATEDAWHRKYLGGYGLGAAVIAARQRPGADPLGPESMLGFCSGLLTGTGVPFAGRFMVVGKSPLTGGWGDANSGGYLSREIKRCGLDAVFVTGKAQKPVWIEVTPHAIMLHDAADLWGRDAPAAEAAVKSRLGRRNVQVAVIGPGGEKRSLIAGIVTDGGRLAARSGLGAVMGAKNLKAIAFHGDRRIPVERPGQVRRISRRFMAGYRRSPLLDRITVRYMHPLSRLIARTGITLPTRAATVRELFRRYGTPGLTVYSAMSGDMPVKNWAGVGYRDYTYESAARNSDESVLRYQRRRYACQACPLGCGGIIDIPAGRFRGTRGHKPEYETISAFGGMLLHDNLEAVIEINEMCNRAGIDTISAGATVAFAVECFQNGLIDTRTTGGLDLDWGNSAEILQLMELMIQRKGFGDLLADGVRRAADRIGPEAARFAMHAGGQELPMHDSRLDAGFAIAYRCEPTPGRHSISSFLYPGLFGVEKQFPAARRMVRQAGSETSKKVRVYVAGSFYMQLVNCAGMCFFGAITSTLPLVEYLNAVTGWDLEADQYFQAAERVLNLRKAFNAREGFGDDRCRLPPRALGNPPLDKGPLKGVSIDIEPLLQEFYAVVGWDPVSGRPTAEKLKQLGLEDLVGLDTQKE